MVPFLFLLIHKSDIALRLYAQRWLQNQQGERVCPWWSKMQLCCYKSRLKSCQTHSRSPKSFAFFLNYWVFHSYCFQPAKNRIQIATWSFPKCCHQPWAFLGCDLLSFECFMLLHFPHCHCRHQTVRRTLLVEAIRRHAQKEKEKRQEQQRTSYRRDLEPVQLSSELWVIR